MSYGFFLKISFLLAFAAAILGLIAFNFLEQDFLEPAHAASLEQKSYRNSAEEIFAAYQSLSANLKVRELKIIAEKNQNYRAGSSYEITCTIENDSAAAVKNFRSIIRTPHTDIASVSTQKLAPGEKIELKGNFTAEGAGIEIIACRTDIEEHVSENREGDNKQIETLYFQ